jgi:hypothetical protein
MDNRTQMQRHLPPSRSALKREKKHSTSITLKATAPCKFWYQTVTRQRMARVVDMKIKSGALVGN